MPLLNSYLRPLSISLIVLSTAFAARSQDPVGDNTMQLNRSSAPSGIPNVSAANLSTNLYTGGLQASLPLYTLKSSDLQIPISLSYTASNGVRPTNPNTVVGMNWTLAAGGSISRYVRGLPDETTNGYTGLSNKGQAVVNDFNSPSNTVTQGFNNVYNQKVTHTTLVDGEPDQFVITTPFFSTSFTLDEQGNAVFRSNNGLKVTHNLFHNIAADTYTFTVTDDQGTQYIFGTTDDTRETTTTKFFGQQFVFISTWYLEKIILLNAKDVVTFTYQAGTDLTLFDYNLTKSFTSTFSSSSGFPPTTDPVSYSNGTVRIANINKVVYNGPKYLSRIITKVGEADFTYTPNSISGNNMAAPPALTSITIKQLDPVTNLSNTTINTFFLSYTDIETGITGQTMPFPSPEIYQFYYKRLLSAITESGNTPSTSTPISLYGLTYYQMLPYPEGSLTQNCDYWGYPNSTQWNTDGSLEDIAYFTDPDNARYPGAFVDQPTGLTLPMAAAFALKQVNVLEGASTVINYEQNEYFNGSANALAGGARVSSIVRKLPTGESLSTQYNYRDTSNHSTGQIWNDLYKKVRMYFGSSCCNFTTLAFTQSPYGIQDANGVIVGYSSVKVTYPSGGYTVSNFTNFSDFPDVITLPSSFAGSTVVAPYNTYVGSQLSSFAYKRGLLKSSGVYKSNGDLISEDINTYGSIEGQPTIKEIGFQDMTWWLDLANFNISSSALPSVNIYHSNIENWRLMQSVHKEHDQKTPANFLQTVTSYTYAADKRQLHAVSTTDSKGQTYTKTFYYADDASIPMVTTPEQTAINALVNANATGVVIHEVESRNGTIHQVHNSFTVVPVNAATNVYLTASGGYAASTLVQQNQFMYDASSSHLTTSNEAGGKPTAVGYAYNLSYPAVEVVNATNTQTMVNQTTTGGSQLFIAAQSNAPQNASFTTALQGTITIAMPSPGSMESGSYCSFFITLTGASGTTFTTNLCSSNGGGSCSSPFSYDFTNMPPDNYTLNVSPDMNTGTSSPIAVLYTYSNAVAVATGYSEYFFEGFEQNSGAISGSSHSGNRYWNSNYIVNFVPPTARSFQIQWWSLSGGKWVFHQMPYTQGMLLSGPVDDIRVFPSDALMTTYTYSPLVGKTSETDPSGKTVTYEYDGLGRILHIRDQDGNILKQFDYGYQIGLQQ